MRKHHLFWSLILLFLWVPQSSALADDMHWAESTLQKAMREKTLPTLTIQTDPDRPITRAEFVSVLVNGHKLIAKDVEKDPFIDCDSSDWFYNDLMTAKTLGVASGYPDGSFRPHDSITRQDAVILLLYALDIHQIVSEDELLLFTDRNEVSSYAQNAMAYAVNQKHLSGYWDNTLRPLASITIAEALTLNEKTMQIKLPSPNGILNTLKIENVSPVSENFRHYEVTYQVDFPASVYYIVKYDNMTPNLGDIDLNAPWSEAAANTLTTEVFSAEPNGETAVVWLLAVDQNGHFIWTSAIFPLVKSSFHSGDGTTENPFAIAKVADLKRIAQVEYLGYHYKLQEDIVLTSSWTPIGTFEAPFTGSFDGNGKVIRGLGINTSNAHAGLFGYVNGVNAEQPAEIKNICLVVGTISGNRYVGGIAGYLGKNAQISSCAVMVNENQAYTATIYGFGRNSCVGGLVGQSDGIITDSYFNGVVTGVSTSEEVNVGGIVGNATGTIQNVYSTAAITGIASSGSVYVGGVAGKARGLLANSMGINQFISGSGELIYSGKIVGNDKGANLLNCFGLADNRDLLLNAPQNGIPVTSFEILNLDLYGQAGLGWDISSDASEGRTWIMDQNAIYPLPILTTGSTALQKNQAVPDSLWY